MKRNLWLILLFSLFAGNAAGREQDAEPIVKQMALVNEAFMSRWPIAGDSIRIKGKRSSNIWTRSVYMEGLLALNEKTKLPPRGNSHAGRTLKAHAG